MLSTFNIRLLYLAILVVCCAQDITDYPQSFCFDPDARTASGYGKCASLVAEFTGCNKTATAHGTAGAACLCRQEIVNGIFEYYHHLWVYILANKCYSCENERRFCLGMNNFGFGMDLLDIWHEKCDAKITFEPTTPILTSYSQIDLNICSSVWDGCVTESAGRAKCRSYTTDKSALLSCMCRTQILAAAYTCSYIGNVSCLEIPGALSDVRGYSYCTDFSSIVRPSVNVWC